MKRLFNAFWYSWAGLRATFQTERAFQQEVALAFFLIPLGLWLGTSGIEKALLVNSVLFVLICELINTAVECVVNRISTDYHPLSGKAKDIASAIVLLALLNAAIVWGCILLDVT